MIRLYLVRHGETELNKSGVYYGSTDCSLSEVGMQESKRMGAALISKNIDVIIASDLKRTVETASIIKDIICSKKDNLEIIKDSRLRELDFGKWESLHYKDVEADYPKEWKIFCEDWKNAEPPNGESFMDLYHRVDKALQEILRTWENKDILIVAHQGTLRVILSKLLCNSEGLYWNFTFSHGCYTQLEIINNHCNIIKINCER